MNRRLFLKALSLSPIAPSLLCAKGKKRSGTRPATLEGTKLVAEEFPAIWSTWTSASSNNVEYAIAVN